MKAIFNFTGCLLECPQQLIYSSDATFLNGCKGVFYFNDILVTGSTDSEHLEILSIVVECSAKANLKLT